MPISVMPVLSGIFLQEGFPTSRNDIQVALLMTVLVKNKGKIIDD
jgi:hypothetical protein